MQSYSTILETPELFDKVIQMIEEGFEYKDGHSYATDFSLLMNNTNWANLHVIHEDNEPIAHIGVRKVKLTEDVSIALLGGISVKSTHQGQGLFNKLMDKIIELYKDEVALFVLWSNLDELYEKYGFHEAGVLIQTGSKKFDLVEASRLGLTKLDLSKVDHQTLSQLNKVYNSTFNKFTSPKRGPMDWGIISTISSTSLYVHKTNNVIDFYAMADKGMDLNGIIHEIAGINPINTKIWLNMLKEFKLWIPARNPWEISDFDSTFYMGIFKIGNSELFSKLIHNWSDGSISITGLSSDEVTFIFGGQEYRKNNGEFLQLLMGPERAEEFSTFEKEFWITGLDSV